MDEVPSRYRGMVGGGLPK
ncbi:hypothetical protein A2U01_0071470, partial [Trifolium medium]|nr:hypothetical protein [Trifolium medium]